MPVTPDIPAAEMAIVEMTNAFRAKHNLSAVRPNAQLTAAARAYAKKLAARAELSHTLDGTTPARRARQAGYAYCEIAENLATIYDSRGFTAREYARRAMNGWKDSPGHRKNLLAPHVTEIGVAVARSPDKESRYVAAQLFGRPHSAQYQFEIANTTTRSVLYEFAGETRLIEPRYTVTMGACIPGVLSFKTGRVKNARARFQARSGHLYTLKPDGAGGVKVEVTPGGVSP